MHQHFNHDFSSHKKLQHLGTASQRPLPNVILPSHPIITVDLSMNVNNIANRQIPRTMLFVSNICFKYAPKWMVSSLILQKNFWGGAPSPFPKPLPHFRSGFAQFMGASHPLLWLRPQLSGAPQPRFGLHSQLSISEIGLTPKYIPGSPNAGPRPLWWIKIDY